MTMTFEQVKTLGPFPAAEIQVSLRKRTATLLLSGPHNPRLEIRLDDEQFEVLQLGLGIKQAALTVGLITEFSSVALVDVDSSRE